MIKIETQMMTPPMRLIIQRYKYPKHRAVIDERAMTSQDLRMSCIH